MAGAFPCGASPAACGNSARSEAIDDSLPCSSKRLLALAWVGLCVPAAFAADTPRSRRPPRRSPTRQPQAALDGLRAKPGVTVREENDWFVLKEPNGRSFWSISQPAHPAHPTVVKRTLVEDTEGIRMVMRVKCGAPKETCDRVVQQFQQGDARAVEQRGGPRKARRADTMSRQGGHDPSGPSSAGSTVGPSGRERAEGPAEDSDAVGVPRRRHPAPAGSLDAGLHAQAVLGHDAFPLRPHLAAADRAAAHVHPAAARGAPRRLRARPRRTPFMRGLPTTPTRP